MLKFLCKDIRLTDEEARPLCPEGKETITYLAGYKHLSSFTREFKKIYGYTPKEFGREGRY